MSFTLFNFSKKIQAGIDACAYTSPTPIQQEAIPKILANRDVLGLAQTGTGKTAAFVLPMLEKLLQGPRKKVRALIVAPTRELAQQINDNIIKMAGHTGLKSAVLYGGVGKQPQIQAVRNGAEIIVACPGRLLDLLNGKSFNLKTIEMLVLDEADHMFDKGFLPDIKRIIKQLPRKRQSLVFSATMPPEIRSLTNDVLYKPVSVQVNHTVAKATIDHELYKLAAGEKTAVLKNIIVEREMSCTLVFTRTKYKARSLAQVLGKSGFSAIALQGNMSQSKRQDAMEGFRDGRYKVLVATDIAARGIDVSGVSHVINYDIPDTVETYTHRTGRTGRAALSGQAISFVEQKDLKMIAAIERKIGIEMKVVEKPSGIKQTKVKSAPPEKKRHSRPVENVGRKTENSKRKSRRRRASSFDFDLNKQA